VLRFNRIATEHVLNCFDKALLPLLALIGMNIELLGQLSHRGLALQRCQRYLRLERRTVVTSLSSRHLLLLLC
jgi:hypothetical protein